MNEELRKLFKELTDEQFHDLLWSCTCYPVDNGEILKEQLLELRKKAGRG